MKTRILIPLLLLALLVVACAGDATTTTAGEAVDDVTEAPEPTETSEPDSAEAGDDEEAVATGGACALLTVDEVAAALEAEVTGTVGDSSQCLYEGTGAISVFSLTYHSEGGQSFYQSFKSAQPQVEEIDGIWDEAIWFEPFTLMIREGDQVIMLQNLLVAQDEAVARAGQELLGQIALGRIRP